jgi:hypothetical protein
MYNPEQVAATHLEADGLGYGDFVKRYAFAYTDMTSKVFGVPVDAGSLVMSVRLLVTVAFVGGGNEDLEAGDSSSATDWLGTGDIAASQYSFGNSIAAGETNAPGKYYSAKDYIIVTAISDAALTAGAAILEVVYSGYGTGPAREQVTP